MSSCSSFLLSSTCNNTGDFTCNSQCLCFYWLCFLDERRRRLRRVPRADPALLNANHWGHLLLRWKQRGILLPVSRCDNLIIILKCALRRPSSIHENVTFLSFYFAICFTCACTTTIQLDCDDDTIIRATKLLDDVCRCMCFGTAISFCSAESQALHFAVSEKTNSRSAVCYTRTEAVY